MNMGEARERIYDLADMFFCGATILWAEQTATKPKPPYVTLKTSGITKSQFPIKDRESGAGYYPCSTTLEINLYTMGKPITVAGGMMGNYENTAQDDLMEFVKFIESEKGLDLLEKYDLDIQLMPPIRDLSELMNDTKYRYRAMAEFTASYTEEARGAYGIANAPNMPNYSGGGSQDLQDAASYVIKGISFKEEGDNEQHKEQS